MKRMAKRKILFDGKHSRFVSLGGWEYIERKNSSGVVCIVAVTNRRRLILVEQFRKPLGKRVIELPAGLAGDSAQFANEPLVEAARRELLEETGYTAATCQNLGTYASSAGLTNEVVTFFSATGLKRTGTGGGDESEDITVHEVKLSELDRWLAKASDDKRIVDARVYTGLYLFNALAAK